MLPPPAAILTAVLVAAASSACTAGRAPGDLPAARFASLDALASRSSPSAAFTAPSAGTPVALMPNWIGKPLRVRQRSDATGFEQALFLALPARGDARGNLVLVSMGRPETASLDAVADGSSAAAPVTPMAVPTEAGIRTEIEAAFPGVGMTVVARPAANAYGPYGLAVGRNARGARCLYAWQWIEDMRAAANAQARAGAAAQAGSDAAGWPAGPLSLRVRLCRDDITLEAMAAAVNQLRLQPPGPAPTIIPPAAAALPDARDAQPIGTATHRHHTHRPARIVSAAQLSMLARRRSVSVVPQAAEPVAVAAAPVGLPGRRYLGADTAAERPAAYATAGYAPAAHATPAPTTARMAGAQGATPGSATLWADLPVEAYRGPQSR